MPGPPSWFGAQLQAAVRNGAVAQSVVDEAARRMLRTLLRAGVIGARAQPRGELLSARNREVALAAARESITLLKNDGGLLPLSLTRIHSLAVIGPNADVPLYQGGGSASVVPARVATPLASLRRLARGVQVVYARGVDNDEVPPPIDPRILSPTPQRKLEGLAFRYFANAGFKAPAVQEGVTRYFDKTMLAGDLAQLSARWEGYLWAPESGSYELSLSQIGTGRLYIDEREIVGPRIATELPARTDFGTPIRLAELTLQARQRYRLRVEYVSQPIAFHSMHVGLRAPAPRIEDAVAAARSSDAAIVLVGSSRATETEGLDRSSMALAGRQDELVQAVLAANPRTIVVVQSGAPYELPWADRAPAIVQAWLNGEAGPQALAEVLLGEINPSGKLPVLPEALAGYSSLPVLQPRAGCRLWRGRVRRLSLLRHQGHRAGLRLRPWVVLYHLRLSEPHRAGAGPAGAAGRGVGRGEQ
jgi:beta-glucosidase